MSLSIPWGKYAGWPIADVPSGYLVWVIEQSNIDEPRRRAIREELAFRLDLQPPAPPPSPPVPLLPPDDLAPTFREMLRSGYRTLSLKLHPDRGGDTMAMERVNAAREWARARGLL